MGSESEIPILDFRGVTLEEGSEERKKLSKKVRETLENHGFFLLKSDEISSKVYEILFTGMKSLFDLPEETKEKFSIPKPYRGYINRGVINPYSQTFGIDSGHNLHIAHQEFIDLMWPEGNRSFSDALGSLTSKTLELSSLILKMVVEGYDLPQQYNLDVEEMGSTNDTRLFRYRLPEELKDSEIALKPHSDKGTLALICENDVQGLQVLSKSGNWIDANIPRNGFLVIAGDILQAWSNGRIPAITHRVVTRGNKDRFSYVFFAVPKDDTVIKVPPELTDENHPLRYRPFKYAKFIHLQHATTTNIGALEKYVGV